MSRFDEYEALVSGAIDSLYGERLRCDPMTSGRYAAGGLDPDRQPFEFVGIVDLRPVVAKSRDLGKSAAAAPTAVDDQVHISVADRAMAYVPRAGDVIVAVGRASPVVFSVAVLEPDGMGRTLLRCRTGSEG